MADGALKVCLFGNNEVSLRQGAVSIHTCTIDGALTRLFKAVLHQ